MAIYHFHAQVLGRGPGRRNQHGGLKVRPDNVVAAAAYRAGERLTDDSRGPEVVHDYARKRGVAHAEIVVPEGGAAWLADRQALWRTVEGMEKRVDAQLAREIDMALPHELTRAQRVELVRDFVAEQFVALGMVADFAVHEPVAARGDDPRNHHAHILLTLRRATAEGLDPVKTRAWNAKEMLGQWRAAWQDHANRALARHGHKARIDHRTLAAQAAAARDQGDARSAALLAREPELHVGPRPRAMQRREVTPRSRVQVVGAPRREDTRQARRSMQERVQAEIAAMERYREKRDAEREAWRTERYEQWLAARQAEREEQAARRRAEAADRRAARRAQLGEGRVPGPAEAARVREARRVAALDRLMGSQADRRIRNYPATDQGPRIGKLWDILTGNNQRAKESIARLNAASARLDRWIDYYDRKITWLVEGQLGGPAFRQARAEAAAAQRRKVAHAQRRADMAKAVAQEVRGLVAALMGQQEKTLVRRRQVEGWTRPHGREQDRGRARHPEGRTRDPR